MDCGSKLSCPHEKMVKSWKFLPTLKLYSQFVALKKLHRNLYLNFNFGKRAFKRLWAFFYKGKRAFKCLFVKIKKLF